ncbi:MAG: DNA repair exonuclease [Clostridia bacterium]|nr:DNA repair exonuclease [Clostridia bacterium]
MSLKIVHCADLHIGASFSYLSHDLAALRSEEIRCAFSEIINYSKARSVDALLICGDLFDSPNPSKQDCDFVKNALESLYPIPVFIICGNHDYMCSDSPFLRQNYFPQNVHVFPCFDHSFNLPHKNAVITGKSYNSSSAEPSFENLNLDSNKINILCLHGDITPSSDYNTISKKVLSSLPCNYAAFGHIHSGEVFEVGNVKCAYSGAAEGHSFNDDGFTGFIYGEITSEKTILTPVSLSKRHYRNISYDISGKDSALIIKELKDLINEKDLFRITLTGEYLSGEKISTVSIKEQLEKDAFYIDIFDESTQGYDFDQIEKEKSLRGEFLRSLRSLCESEEEYILSAKAGLDALSGKIPNIECEL